MKELSDLKRYHANRNAIEVYKEPVMQEKGKVT